MKSQQRNNIIIEVEYNDTNLSQGQINAIDNLIRIEGLTWTSLACFAAYYTNSPGKTSDGDTKMMVSQSMRSRLHYCYSVT